MTMFERLWAALSRRKRKTIDPEKMVNPDNYRYWLRRQGEMRQQQQGGLAEHLAEVYGYGATNAKKPPGKP